MEKLMLNHAGKEYLHFPVTGLPSNWVGASGAMMIRFPPSVTWVAMEWAIQNATTGLWSVWNGVTGLPTHARVLLAGPDATAGGTVVLGLGSFMPELMLASAPEVIVRTSPAVVVVFSS